MVCLLINTVYYNTHTHTRVLCIFFYEHFLPVYQGKYFMKIKNSNPNIIGIIINYDEKNLTVLLINYFYIINCCIRKCINNLNCTIENIQ